MKIDQIKLKIKECADYVDKIFSHQFFPIQINERPFSELKNLISDTDIREAAELERVIEKLLREKNMIYPARLGRILAVLNILSDKYENITNRYKFFISHSSKDTPIIKKFLEKILRLGCKFDEDDIFCTSIEGMGIKTGEDIRSHIKKSMQLSDYIFIMISKNYIKSDICLNEMGASWVLEKKVKPFLLPPLEYDAIWLSEVLKNSHINDSAALDSLRDELIAEYTLKKGTTSNWNDQKNEFITYMNELVT